VGVDHVNLSALALAASHSAYVSPGSCGRNRPLVEVQVGVVTEIRQ
jgi:hypothetical protein